MPKQINNIDITEIGDGNYNVQIGPLGYTVTHADLFGTVAPNGDRQIPEQDRNLQVIRNIRIVNGLTGFDLTSAEFLAAVNQQNGLECGDRRYWIRSIDLVDAETQQYRIGLSTSKNNIVAWTLDVEKSQITGPDLPTEEGNRTILLNIRSSLRVDGHTSLTASAAASIRGRVFRA